MIEHSIIKQISSITLPIIKLIINWWWEEFEKGAASYLLSLSFFTLEFQLGKQSSSDLESGKLARTSDCSNFLFLKFFCGTFSINVAIIPSPVFTKKQKFRELNNEILETGLLTF
ncbi:MAG: hypothetical protein JRF60_11355 [Deltaproteobacteria bacterium]|nr:hypothetical protein [Deltaproteobacteria bacterium]